jgi:hypothetical protein
MKKQVIRIRFILTLFDLLLMFHEKKIQQLKIISLSINKDKTIILNYSLSIINFIITLPMYKKQK